MTGDNMVCTILSSAPPRLKRQLVVLVTAIVCLASAGQLARADTPQYRWVGDLPIMTGWAIEAELGFSFDSPNGRIVMVFASTSATAADIMAFYTPALAQLGWTGGAGSWTRDGEKLVISEVETARGPLWRLMLQPNS
ncbi:MAG: hypothetical protein EBR92_08040 [Alphaproteobacteria bacterium]|jgi:hypothetical protein|nr:hypothetical protein [Alphaproteobacteria bacterium]